ncbi:DNRLRE domain-containing protein [Methylotenera sp.]|uniref:Kelch repeat-containing protein n=1 Tax=Methylotenera sp. TaxID=2051956 RepID=UPI00248706F9|nr:DNRLRE domain-containing protein [Methylotenera sp.]MDI1298376.1 DNRLRE domain-containing protein [Methylotenera sp.]
MRQHTIKTSARLAGFTLLPVVLAMSLIAAIAFLINRDNGMNTDMVVNQMNTDRARYAAEAGLQAANAKVQSISCGGGFPVVGTPVTNSNFGGTSYSAYATSAGGNTTSLISKGTYNGTSVTLTRNNIYVYQSPAVTYTMQPNATVGMDTYIDSAAESNYGLTSALAIKKSQQSLLYKFDFSTFPIGSRPISAKFSIYASGGLLGAVELYRMTRDWVEGTGANSPLDGATWNTTNGSTLWTTPGGDYHPVKLDTQISTGSAWVDFNATDLTIAWLSGKYPNYGALVKSTGEVGTFKFTSSDDSDATKRPKITFSYLLPCGTTGPVDTPHGTVTLSPIADSFNDTNILLQFNNGKATTLKVYNSPSLENRILTQFDTSSIPAGVSIQSAKLRMYVSAVGSATTNTKSIWVNAINESWVEGAGNNTAKLICPLTPSAGTSWYYRTGCTNWASNLHPPYTAQSWTTMSNMPTARTNHMVATVNNKIYTIGGYNPVGGYFNTVEEYDPATNTWATKASMPTNRSDAAIAVVNGKIYVMGGTANGITALSVNEVYDPSNNTWATKANMPTGRMFFSAAAVNNKIYAIGGNKTNTALKTNEEYDPATNTWATKTTMTTARAYLTVQAINGKIYAIGGWAGFLSLSNNEMYDPSTNTWTNKAVLPIATDTMASAVVCNKIYLIAGKQSGFNTSTVRVYDTINNNYITQLNYPMALEYAGAAAVNGYIYSLGGDDAVSVVYTNHYKFDTGTPTAVATASDESTAASPLAANFTSGWINFELKPLVQEWVDGVRMNNGIVIYTEVSDQFSINSRENSTKNPQLIVTY